MSESKVVRCPECAIKTVAWFSDTEYGTFGKINCPRGHGVRKYGGEAVTWFKRLREAE